MYQRLASECEVSVWLLNTQVWLFSQSGEKKQNTHSMTEEQLLEDYVQHLAV